MIAKKKTYKLDIFELMQQIDAGNMDYFKKLPEDSKKGFTPITVHRWLLGNKNPDNLLLLDALVNSQLFNLHSNPDLLYKLMVASTAHRRGRVYYVKSSKSPVTFDDKTKTIAKYYNCSHKRAASYSKLLDIDDVVEMAEEMAESDVFIRKLSKL